MKDALTALLIAAPLALFHITAFTPRNSLITYIALVAFWTVPIASFCIVRNVIHNRRLRLENADTKELPVPDTQPLDRK